MPEGSSLIDRLLHHAAVRPDHDALVSSSFTLSYARLAKLVEAQTCILLAAGISHQSTVGLRLANDVQHLIACLASIRIGATSCSIASFEPEDVQQASMRHCDASHLVDEALAIDPMLFSKEHTGPLQHAPAATARLLFSTSGTTGEPKLVVHDDKGLVAQAHRHISSEHERFACLTSMQYNFVKRHRLYCVAVGATNVFVDPQGESLAEQLESCNANVLHVSAFQAQELLATPGMDKLSDLRLKLGGSHVPLALRRKLREYITAKLQAGYGTTETGAIGFTEPGDTDAGESVGRALPGIDVRIVSQNRTPLKRGQRGEIAIRCDGMFREYHARPDLTSARLEDGWFYTGDIAYLDSRERIHLCGRSDEMFVFNSLNIYPQDIESQLRQHPDVLDAAVLPQKSCVHGQIPVALVVLRTGAQVDLGVLKKFVRDRVGIRYPRQISPVDAIPRNTAGKILRNEAAALVTRSEQLRASIVKTLNGGETPRLKTKIAAAFMRGDADIMLSELELDSLARMDLMVMLEVEYAIVLAPDAFSELESLGAICALALSLPDSDAAEAAPADGRSQPLTASGEVGPYIVRFFQRVFHHCHTVAQLNKALMTLEHRLTPIEIDVLQQQQADGRLIPAASAAKYVTTLELWFARMTRMMADSGKSLAEPFTSRRIAPAVTLFSGTGPAAAKTLIVCFPGSGDRKLLMPNAVLMQHTDAAAFDLLIVSEPLREGYRFGVPLLGGSMTEVAEWLADLKLVGDYKQVRTFGCSAGGYAAIVAAYLLRAEMGVSIGGRFHSERYPARILDRIVTTWRAVRRGHCSSTLLCYAMDKTRDQSFARVIGRMTRGRLLGLEFSDDQVGHLILLRLAERGELAAFLARTIFCEAEQDGAKAKNRHSVMTLPANTVRPRKQPRA